VRRSDMTIRIALYLESLGINVLTPKHNLVLAEELLTYVEVQGMAPPAAFFEFEDGDKYVVNEWESEDATNT